MVLFRQGTKKLEKMNHANASIAAAKGAGLQTD